MLAIGLILNILGIGVFCWLIFELTVYALPFLVGFSIARAALQSGAGIIGTLLTGIAAGAAAITIGQLAFAARPLILRKLIGAAFVAPAALASYDLILAVSQIGVPSLLWREVFAWIGAICVGATVWSRLALYAGLRSFDWGSAVRSEMRQE
ncbi:hypothetical protein CQ12_16500 [Bradyrhizobium jicamae]|uniref:Uncharacterized protein n=1 Tax=Bradyrhizobium jicamae TaxID=280332 RepID=A0A0R3LGV6_9BRAD|nr:hypothetical protein [Bradyrhizobium jicamae]KRR06430.1 hypothetical protein CQ12_16500 [Bradyrhizobium jicamae]